MNFSVRLALFLSAIGACSGWKLEQIQEQKCLADPPKTTSKLDFNFLQSVPIWYYNRGSRLDMYRTASEVLQVEVEQVRDTELYYRACFQLKFSGNDSYVQGFGGKRWPTTLIPQPDGSFDWTDAHGNLQGRTTIPLTDNKTFIFFYACWVDGLASWGVTTTTPTLDPKAVEQIHALAKSLGYQEDNFTHIEYDACNLP